MYGTLSRKLEECRNDYNNLTSLYDEIVEAYNNNQLSGDERSLLFTYYFSFKEELESKM